MLLLSSMYSKSIFRHLFPFACFSVLLFLISGAVCSLNGSTERKTKGVRYHMVGFEKFGFDAGGLGCARLLFLFLTSVFVFHCLNH